MVIKNTSSIRTISSTKELVSIRTRLIKSLTERGISYKSVGFIQKNGTYKFIVVLDKNRSVPRFLKSGYFENNPIEVQHLPSLVSKLMQTRPFPSFWNKWRNTVKVTVEN
ncbi:MAG: hypothetical protein ACI9GH_000492 [Candidatus Paceibacteria bacterium]|jgi:hypothetical protein